MVTRERSWFGDVHRRSRTLRLTPHPAERMVTLSLWEGERCQGTVRLADSEVSALVSALAEALAGSAAYVPPPPPPPSTVAAPPSSATVIPLPTAAEDQVAVWMHGPPTDPPDRPLPPDVLVTAVSRAVTVVGRAARLVADRLAPQAPEPPDDESRRDG